VLKKVVLAFFNYFFARDVASASLSNCLTWNLRDLALHPCTAPETCFFNMLLIIKAKPIDDNLSGVFYGGRGQKNIVIYL